MKPLIAIAAILLLFGCGQKPGIPSEMFNAMEIARASSHITTDILLTDLRYTAVDPAWVKSGLHADVVKEMRGYQGRDCDDYAIAALHLAARHYRYGNTQAGPAYGVVVLWKVDGSRHAQNWFVDQERIVWFHEPQTGHVYLPDEQERQGVIWVWM
jgi:hypothetical protein